MSLDSKDNHNLITSYLEKSKSNASKKRNSSVLSPVEQEHQSKKVDTWEAKMNPNNETTTT